MRARKMISRSGVSGEEQKLLLEVLAKIEAFQHGNYKGDRELLVGRIVQAVQRCTAVAQKLDARRQAAAWLAADEILFMGCPSLIGMPEPGSAARLELGKLGADFNYSPLGITFVYTRAWLKKALEIDPEGPAGDLAFRILMEMGFDTSGTCLGGKEMFRKVIEQGELFLKKTHDLESLAAVKFMVGVAYRDIVSLADGAEPYAPYVTDEEMKDYRGMAAEVKRKAIQYFRQALPKAGYTYETISTWTDAWRMIAGLPPVHARYFCVYD